MVEAINTVPDYKAFRQVSTPAGVSMLVSNLSCKDGTSFVTCKNTAEGGKVALYGANVVTQEQDVVQPTLSVVSHKTDCIRAQFHKIQGQHYIVICHLAVCLIYNANLTRRLFSYEISQAI